MKIHKNHNILFQTPIFPVITYVIIFVEDKSQLNCELREKWNTIRTRTYTYTYVYGHSFIDVFSTQAHHTYRHFSLHYTFQCNSHKIKLLQVALISYLLHSFVF